MTLFKKKLPVRFLINHCHVPKLSPARAIVRAMLLIRNLNLLLAWKADWK